MKRIWLMAVALTMVAALATGVGTLALFSSDPASQTDTITTGTLAIVGDRDQGDTVPGPMFYTTAAEGETSPGLEDGLKATGFWFPGLEVVRVFQIENIGSADAKLINVSAALETDNSALADILDVKVYADEAKTQLLVSGKLRDYLTAPVPFAAGTELASGDLGSYWFVVSMPRTAGNEYQGLGLRVSFNVYAEQLANNP
jgi:hypothetical protein